MKKAVIIASVSVLLMCSCTSEFNAVYKYGDNEVKYEYAKEAFARGKFSQASQLLEELVTMKKGSAASETFKKYTTSYPRGHYVEPAYFYVGQSLYESSPEPRLDQSPTNGAITAYQQFMDLYPDSRMRPQAQERLYELTDKLIQKEYLSAQLYYNLGGYFGNINSNDESNYTSSIITAQNTLKNYPYCSLREDFMLLIMKSKFQLAENSSDEKRLDRYRDAEDECYGFINEFPESKNVALAEKYIVKCKKVTKD